MEKELLKNAMRSIRRNLDLVDGLVAKKEFSACQLIFVELRAKIGLLWEMELIECRHSEILLNIVRKHEEELWNV